MNRIHNTNKINNTGNINRSNKFWNKDLLEYIVQKLGEAQSPYAAGINANDDTRQNIISRNTSMNVNMNQCVLNIGQVPNYFISKLERAYIQEGIPTVSSAAATPINVITARTAVTIRTDGITARTSGNTVRITGETTETTETTIIGTARTAVATGTDGTIAVTSGTDRTNIGTTAVTTGTDGMTAVTTGTDGMTAVTPGTDGTTIGMTAVTPGTDGTTIGMTAVTPGTDGTTIGTTAVTSGTDGTTTETIETARNVGTTTGTTAVTIETGSNVGTTDTVNTVDIIDTTDHLDNIGMSKEIIDNLYILKVNTKNSLLHSILGLLDKSYRTVPWERKEYMMSLFRGKILSDIERNKSIIEKLMHVKIKKEDVQKDIQCKQPTDLLKYFISVYFGINLIIVMNDKIETVPKNINRYAPSLLFYQYPFGNMAPIIQGHQIDQVMLLSRSQIMQALFGSFITSDNIESIGKINLTNDIGSSTSNIISSRPISLISIPTPSTPSTSTPSTLSTSTSIPSSIISSKSISISPPTPSSVSPAPIPTLRTPTPTLRTPSTPSTPTHTTTTPTITTTPTTPTTSTIPTIPTTPTPTTLSTPSTSIPPISLINTNVIDVKNINIPTSIPVIAVIAEYEPNSKLQSHQSQPDNDKINKNIIKQVMNQDKIDKDKKIKELLKLTLSEIQILCQSHMINTTKPASKKDTMKNLTKKELVELLADKYTL